MSDTPTPAIDHNHHRRAPRKLKALREVQAAGKGVAFPNDFKPAHHVADLQAQYAGSDAEALETAPVTVSVAGRMMLKRVMGKASFATVQDGSLGTTGAVCSSMSRAMRWVKSCMPPSSTGTWETSWVPRARS